MDKLPDADDIIRFIRAALADGRTPASINTQLTNCAPTLDQLTDTTGAATWLHLTTASIYRDRTRHDTTGRPRWPQPDHEEPGRAGRTSPRWRYRTLAWHRALQPGQGSAGRGRPAKRPT